MGSICLNFHFRASCPPSDSPLCSYEARDPPTCSRGGQVAHLYPRALNYPNSELEKVSSLPLWASGLPRSFLPLFSPLDQMLKILFPELLSGWSSEQCKTPHWGWREGGLPTMLPPYPPSSEACLLAGHRAQKIVAELIGAKERKGRDSFLHVKTGKHTLKITPTGEIGNTNKRKPAGRDGAFVTAAWPASSSSGEISGQRRVPGAFPLGGQSE